MKLIRLIISEPRRPIIPDYGISEEKTCLVSWNDVNSWMDQSKNYWINTIRGNFPHSRPIWGIWFENIFYFGGGSETRNAKNLQQNNNISVHTESGENVVIIEGYTEQFSDEELNRFLGELYQKRYGMFHPPPFWRVIPRTVFACQMSDFVNTPTKFTCKVEYLDRVYPG